MHIVTTSRDVQERRGWLAGGRVAPHPRPVPCGRACGRAGGAMAHAPGTSTSTELARR